MSFDSLDIVVPVYNEDENILKFFACLEENVKTRACVLICYDHEDDSTLKALKNYTPSTDSLTYRFIKNTGKGPHGAVMSGFHASKSRAILVIPADDFFNARIIDKMVLEVQRGADIVCASRLMPGGVMEGAPFLKGTLVRLAGFTLNKFAKVPTHDATSGFRMFSKRLLKSVPIESELGFTYSIELLVKCHRIGGKVVELPALWFERTAGESRFTVGKWVLAYTRWYLYAFATTFLKRKMKPDVLRAYKGIES